MMRDQAKAALGRLGVLGAARDLRDALKASGEPARREEFAQFQRAFGAALGHRLSAGQAPRGPALIAGLGFDGGVKIELGLIKALELAGFEPVVINRRDHWLARYYRLAGVRRMFFWDDLVGPWPRAEARRALSGIRDSDELLSWTWHGVRVGRFAAATALRRLRVGSLPLDDAKVRASVEAALAEGLACAEAARRLVDEVQPRLVLVVDRGYTPQGELFDVCLRRGIDVVAWYAAHKSNALILKRYSTQNQDEHYSSLSQASWEVVRRMAWTPAHRQALHQELHGAYASGDWHSEVGTQFNTRLLEADALRTRLGLAPGRKTALIFPHILWDGTFFWGTDLFRSYEEWFVETVKAACANPAVNWVIKVHPANLVKDARDGLRGQPAELLALRRAVGALPPHVTVIPHDSDISTLSLFGIADYCVTVRGTVGIEAASLGVHALTAGTGRYDRRGFTIDSDSKEAYLERLARIQDLPPLSATQRELAERFAYGILLLRPLALRAFSCEYQHDAKASCRVRIHAATRQEWAGSPDMRALAVWLSGSTDEDFLMERPQAAPPAEQALVTAG